MADWYRYRDDVITLTLHVQPGAKRSEIVGLHGDALKIKLAAPPIEGRANEALLKFISDLLDIPLRNLELIHGAQSRNKVLSIRDCKIDPSILLPAK